MTGDSLRLENNLRLGIVGNPENRRVRDFQSTAIQLGLNLPQVVSWWDVIEHPRRSDALLSTFDLLRIDSPGENAAVQQRLIRSGGGSPGIKLAHGELGSLREAHLGFTQQLNRLSQIDVAFQNSPTDIGVMFDKWASHVAFASAGLPRPFTQRAPTTPVNFREQRAAFGRAHGGRLFLKPRYSSSAAGVCAYRWSGDREQLIAPIEIDRRSGQNRLFNSLKVRTYTRTEDVQLILAQLLPQDMICEQWIPKARLSRCEPLERYDFRIIVIAGEARHCVVRQSRHPMTNLHLGNRRGDLKQVRETLGSDTFRLLNECAERAAACFSNSLYAGVDLIVTRNGEPFVCEINAFGDLLPGLQHRDESVYEAILRASCEPAASGQSLRSVQ